ncbi:MAG: HypC/HybG/HupF family hydrogenase formation chaperone [Gracilibacteraceae bacterium]|jgi:hydrogenase expression/formation protein HypC|nr:HypC/HybG/HupF family hydrogenase formation chaperone [Gracilibacteraceae bacterium]
MCVALPGKIISIEDNTGRVDFGGSLVAVNLGVVRAKVGDYVLVHAGCALEVMREDLAEDLISLFADAEDSFHAGL